jgi:uncharacterized protein YbjT (DUF2867 family)
MRIVVIGAYGLLGGYVTARLLRDGHEVVGLGRDITAAARRFPAVNWVRADLRTMRPDGWVKVLAGVDAVVNCAGALQDSPRDDLHAVHVKAVSALAEACATTGVRRLVHISAAGVERMRGRFSQTKNAADEALRSTALDWVILRPGLVLAPAAYGGSALLRGLAAFPGCIPALAPDAPVQTVSVADVAEAVARSVLLSAPARISCDLVADEETRLRDILVASRGWLGLSPARVIAAPRAIGRLGACIADGLAWLGWRSPMRTAAVEQLAAGVRGQAEDAQKHLGFTPRGLAETLSEPSGVQDRWFGRMYFLKPAVLATLAGFWCASGIIGLMNHAEATHLLTDQGMRQGLAASFVGVGGVLDIALAMLVLARRTAPLALKGMIATTAAYLTGATLWLPELWGDPLGALVKSVPAAVLALAGLAMMDER